MRAGLASPERGRKLRPMATGSALDPLLAELHGFERDLRDIGYRLVAQIFAEELARRERDAPPAPPRAVARQAPSPTRTADAAPARGQWTRDAVVQELARWLLGGNPVEAAFLIRHRQRALVTNAKKFFGRFEAALNAANLHLAKEYPDGIPSAKKK